MRSFRHVNARSLEEVYRLLAEHGRKAFVNAGGTDLLGLLKDNLLPEGPAVVVNLKGVPDLAGLRETEGGLVIGALTSLTKVHASPLVRARYPVLAEAAHAVGTPQLRNMGTLAGNLCQEVRCWYYRYPDAVGGAVGCLRKGNGPCLAVKGDNRYHAILGGKKCYAVCPSDTAVALAALDAVVRIGRAGGQREVPVRDFYTPLANVLEPGELVTEVRVPPAPAGASQRFLKFAARKAVDFATASVAAVVTVQAGACRDVRLALGAVAPGPVRATAAEELLRGLALTAQAAAEAAETALAGAKPLSGNAYKVDIAKALVRRALTGSEA